MLSISQTRDQINEPASLIPKIIEAAESRSDKKTDLDLIYCRFFNHMPDHMESVSQDLLKIVSNLDSTNIIKNDTLFALFKYKRNISDKNIYPIYWEKITNDLKKKIQNHTHPMEIISTLLTISTRYCLLQNGMTSKHRYRTLELLLKELILKEIKHGQAAYNPKRSVFFFFNNCHHLC